MRLRIAMTAALILGGLATVVWAHGGGIDSQGGHNNRKVGNYHFHRGPLKGQTFSSKSAGAAALRAKDKPAASSKSTERSGATSDQKIDALISVLIENGYLTQSELNQAIRDGAK